MHEVTPPLPHLSSWCGAGKGLPLLKQIITIGFTFCFTEMNIILFYVKTAWEMGPIFSVS
jgi:hypothetical protein